MDTRQCIHCNQSSSTLSLMRLCDDCVSNFYIEETHPYFDEDDTEYKKLRNAIKPIIQSTRLQYEFFLWLSYALTDKFLILFISGPSGAGKTALCNLLRSVLGSDMCAYRTNCIDPNKISYPDGNDPSNTSLIILDNCDLDDIHFAKTTETCSVIYSGNNEPPVQPENVEMVASYLCLFNEIQNINYNRDIKLKDQDIKCQFLDVVMWMHEMHENRKY